MKTILVIAALVSLAACDTTTQQRNPPPTQSNEARFRAVYKQVRPAGDQSGDQQIDALGKQICRKLGQGVEYPKIVGILVTDLSGEPTGMTQGDADYLVKSAVRFLCPEQSGNLR